MTAPRTGEVRGAYGSTGKRLIGWWKTARFSSHSMIAPALNVTVCLHAQGYGAGYMGGYLWGYRVCGPTNT